MAKDTKITNCVVSCDTHSKFVLEQLAAKLPDAEYAPESFPGLVYRVSEPKASVLVFSTGKMICSGTKSLEQAKQAVKAALVNFRAIGMEISDRLNTEVVNIVASSDLGSPIELNNVIFNLDNCEYEPEQFPGVVHRIDTPKTVFLIFSSGKIVITGAKSVKHLEDAILELERELKELKIIK